MQKILLLELVVSATESPLFAQLNLELHFHRNSSEDLPVFEYDPQMSALGTLLEQLYLGGDEEDTQT